MNVSLGEMGNHASRILAAIEAGESVVLIADGRPVADIVPRQVANERRPTSLLLADLESISIRAAELGVVSNAGDFDVGWTIQDLLP